MFPVDFQKYSTVSETEVYNQTETIQYALKPTSSDFSKTQFSELSHSHSF